MSAISPYTYAGRRLDSEAGLYNYRNRIYHPQLGRFITRDPVGYLDGYNLYEYVDGKPIKQGVHRTVPANTGMGLASPDSIRWLTMPKG